MTTLAVLKQRIADEVARDDLTVQIAYAISDAVKHYQPSRFWFTESRSECVFSTVAAQEFYTSADEADIPNLLRIDQITLLDGTVKYELIRADDREIEIFDSATSNRSRPSLFSYLGGQLRFYPIPDAVYTVRVAGITRLAVPSDDSGSNAWTNDAEELIRNRAKYLLYRDVIRDKGEAAVAKAAEMEALRRLEAETHARTATGTIAVWEF